MSNKPRARRMGAVSVYVYLVVVVSSGAPAAAETITFLTPILPPTPGDSFSTLIELTGNDPGNEIGAYALDINLLPEAGSTGTVTSRLAPEVPRTNFYNINNLIDAPATSSLSGGSTIFPGDHDGADIFALSAGFTNVDLAGTGHSILAELVFDVSPDASGYFTIELGPGTELKHFEVSGSPTPSVTVDATLESLTVEIVPEPSGLGLLAAACFFAWHRGRNPSIIS
ncbi:MAG: hypothetical protein GY842_04025 [bacterium]|nr:hypothetical protein [bacterium]